MLYSKKTGGFYSLAIHGAKIPDDAVEISNAEHALLLDGQAAGSAIGSSPSGRPILIDPPTVAVTVEYLCAAIDTAADAARRSVAGDSLRAVEYDRARIAAEQYAASGYAGEVPAMVAAWAINGRTPQQAADNILSEAAAYTGALELLRTTRLAAKEQVRALMGAGELEQAQLLTEQTIAEIEAAVAGLGNNA